MVQILACGNLDVSKVDNDAIAIDNSAWLVADVDEKVYFYKLDPNDPDEPFVNFAVIKFSSACVATVCDNQTPRQVQWANGVPSESLKQNLDSERSFALDATQQFATQTNQTLKDFGISAVNDGIGVPQWNVINQIPPNNIDANLVDNFQKGIDNHSINDLGFQPVAVRPLGAVIPMRSNVEPYGPWISSNFNTSAGGIDVSVQPDLAPWTFGSLDMLNAVGSTLVEYNARGLAKAENGSVTLVGIPASGHGLPKLGDKVGITGPNLTSVNFSLGTKGATTTYEFKTYTPKFGKLSKLFIDRYKNLHKQRTKQLRLLRKVTVEQNKLYRKIAARSAREKLDTIKSDARTNSMQRVIIGYMDDWYDMGGDLSQKSVVGISTLAKASLETIDNYTNKAMLSLDGIFSPATFAATINLPQVTTPNDPTTYCSIHPMPPAADYNGSIINTENYDPFSKGGHPYHEGIAPGHCIDLVGGRTIGQSGLMNSFYDWRDPDKYGDQPYNFIALRGPLMLHSWGYDLEGKPVPNAGGGSNNFATNWLQKPKTWPVAPIDLRFDAERGVWTSPPPYRIVVVKLRATLSPFGQADAVVQEGEGYWVVVQDKIGKEGKADSLCYAYFDTHSKQYLLLECQPQSQPIRATVVTDVYFGGTLNDETGESGQAIMYDTAEIELDVSNTNIGNIVVFAEACPVPSGSGTGSGGTGSGG